jgi:methyl-accepting chemotaxis protein
MPTTNQMPTADPLSMVVYEVQELRNDLKETRKEIKDDMQSIRDNFSEITEKIATNLTEHAKQITELSTTVNNKVEHCDNNGEKLAALEKICAECKPKVDQIIQLKHRFSIMLFTIIGSLTVAGIVGIVKLALGK